MTISSGFVCTGCCRTSILALVILVVYANGQIQSPEEVDNEQAAVNALSAFSLRLTKVSHSLK